MLDALRAQTIVTLTPFYDRVKRVQGRVGLRHVIATSIKEYLPVLRLLFTVFKERKDGHRIHLASGDHWMGQLLRAHTGSARPPVEVGAGDQAVILSSGGTTGTPKGVVGTDIRRRRTPTVRMDEVGKRPWVDVIMLPLPLFHVYANVGVQPLAFLEPNPISLVPNPRDIDDLLKTIQSVKPAFFNGVPTLYRDPESPTGSSGQNRSQFNQVVLLRVRRADGGDEAAVREDRCADCRGCSLTEGMMACCVNPVQGTNKIGSIGVPLPDVDVRIVDAETGIGDVPCGQVGEMIMHAPQYMAEYWNNPHETAEALRVREDGRTWLHTGDLAYMDQDGYVFLVDRKKRHAEDQRVSSVAARNRRGHLDSPRRP